MKKVVQEAFGESIIKMIVDFVKNDLKSIADIEQDEFSHVKDAQLRRAISETFYGARWIYKLGLALLVRDEIQIAHVRSQVVDYAAVCEGLLSDCILHGLNNERMKGKRFAFSDTVKLQGAINWNIQDRLPELKKRSFYWNIEVSSEEDIISQKTTKKLHAMRKERNTVHLRERTYHAYIGTSKSLFHTVMTVISDTKAWRSNVR